MPLRVCSSPVASQRPCCGCSDVTLAQNGKFVALDCTNSSTGETCVVGCDLGYELVSGNSPRTLTGVSKNENVACLTGSLSACRVTRRSTCYQPWSNWVVGFGPATHTEPSGFVISQSESNSAPPYPSHEAEKCFDVAAGGSSTFARQIARTGPPVTRAK